MKKRVAVIGAGRGHRRLARIPVRRRQGRRDPEIVCYESRTTGAVVELHRHRPRRIWRAVHCSMYRYLWSNGPKGMSEFADYTFWSISPADRVLSAACRPMGLHQGPRRESGCAWLKLPDTRARGRVQRKDQRFYGDCARPHQGHSLSSGRVRSCRGRFGHFSVPNAAGIPRLQEFQRPRPSFPTTSATLWSSKARTSC